MTTVGELVDLIGRIAPWRLAEDWDNPGLQVGRLDAPADRVAIALDPVPATIRGAAETQAQVLLTHHPLIFRPLKQINLADPTAAAVALALETGLSVVAAHTNLDAAEGGVAQVLADRLGLTEVRPLEPVAAARDDSRPGFGFGAVGDLKKEYTFGELTEMIKEELELRGVRSFPGAGPVLRVAVMPGSGGGFVRQAFESGAQALITGDVGYHQAREAEFYGIGIIDAGHFGTEKPVLDRLARLLARAAEQMKVNIQTTVLNCEDDPWFFEEGRR